MRKRVFKDFSLCFLKEKIDTVGKKLEIVNKMLNEADSQ